MEEYTYNEDTKKGYLSLTTGIVSRREKVGNLVVEYDTSGTVVGIEILESPTS